MPEDFLGFWGRVGVVSVGSSIVLISIAVVACIVGQKCCASAFYPQEEDLEKKKHKKGEKDRLCGSEPPLIYYRTSINSEHPTQDHKYWSALSEKNNFNGTATHTTIPFTPSTTNADNNSLLGAISTKRDSTYSSMSENSGRTSPSNSFRQSSVEGSSCSGGVSMVSSPTGGETNGQISFTVQFVVTNEERGSGKLIITVMEARGLQGRQYMGGACDPYVRVIIWKERRSLRKQKSPPLHMYRTRTVRHTTNPSFNETFVLEVNKNELKELMVKVVAMDCDKWVSPTTLGEVVQPLKDIKSLPSNVDRMHLNFFLAPAKLDFGEVLFGLCYLPTAQRLSVSIIKANHLKYTNVVTKLQDFHPYVRVILISPSGRVLRKKKTNFVSNTDKPVWNETLIFDMPQELIENATFILAVCTRLQSQVSEQKLEADVNHEIEEYLRLSTPSPRSSIVSSSSSYEGSYRKQDKYVGKVVLGCRVSGEDEKRHWMAVLSAPRKVTSQWHALK